MIDGMSLIRLPDGRNIEVLQGGRVGGRALVLHLGTPNAAANWARLTDAAERNGLAVITCSRPGYGRSDPHPGRRVADAATDTAAVLDQLGIDEFVAMGISGGGPHVLACAALLPGRCLAIADVCGLAPRHPDISQTDGMAEANVAWLTAAAAGRDALAPFAAAQHAFLGSVDAATMQQVALTSMPAVDAAAFTGDLAEALTTMLRRAFERGSAGYVEDSLAFVADPGFVLDDIRCPLSVWHGDADVNVPPAHSRWLVSRLPQARAHLFAAHGHVSLLQEIDHIVDELAGMAADVDGRCRQT